MTPITFDDFKLVSIPRALLDLMKDPPYRLERDDEPATVDDGLSWLKEWHDGDGRHIWAAASDKQRRRAFKHWRWLRWRFRAEWRQRGGHDE